MATRHDAARQPPQLPEAGPETPVDSRIRLLAREIYRELKRSGCSPRQVVIIIEQLISQAADEMQRERDG